MIQFASCRCSTTAAATRSLSLSVNGRSDRLGVGLTFNEGPRSQVFVGSKEDAEVTAIVAIGQGDEFVAMLTDMAGEGLTRR